MLTESPEKRVRPSTWWRAIAYLAVFIPLLFVGAWPWIRPDFKWQEPSDWRPALALAEASREKGDPYEARVLYFRAARIASRLEDWESLLAVACGVKRLNGNRAADFDARTILVRAMMAAESRRSRAGMSAVAGAFASFGEHPAAAMVLSRVQPGWPEEVESRSEADAKGCREPDETVPRSPAHDGEEK